MKEHEPNAAAQGVLLPRFALYGLASLLVLGLVACGWLILESRRPIPGANMALMGLPLVALPTAIVALCLLFAAFFLGRRLPLVERLILTAASLAAVVAFGLLFVLG